MISKNDKSKISKKQKRQAKHIEEGYESKGISEKESKRRAFATVNKNRHENSKHKNA